MPGILRDNEDLAGGIFTTGSPNVFVNGFPVVRIGDHIASHGIGLHASATMATGSSTVFCNGIAICRAGDVATCSHTGTPGESFNVFAG